jgi:hypothetical protein
MKGLIGNEKRAGSVGELWRKVWYANGEKGVDQARVVLDRFGRLWHRPSHDHQEAQNGVRASGKVQRCRQHSA